MGNLTTTLRPNQPLPPLYNRIGDMESPAEDDRARGQGFNAKAATFNPAAASFQPRSSFQQDWTNDFDNHVKNLGIPVAPSQSHEGLSQEDLQKGTGGMAVREEHLDPSLDFNPTTGLSTSNDNATQDIEDTSILFPPDARVRGLDGRLVNEALHRTLTAKELARYLEDSGGVKLGGNSSSDSTPARSPDSDKTVTPHRRCSEHEHNIPQPRPIAMPQYPEMDLLHSEARMRRLQQVACTPPTAPRAMMGTPDLYHPIPGSGFPVSSPHHTRVPSHDSPQSAARFAARPRRASNRRPYVPRAKRTDQGPMPSSADIYPDDAAVRAPNWDAAAGIYEQQRRDSGASMLEYHRRMSEPKQSKLKDLRVEDAAAWPTPAEALKGDKPANIASELVAPPVQEMENLSVRTPEEYHAEQYRRHDLTISSTSPTAIMNHGISQELIPDVRPLTPGQLDGSRYGLRWFGVGYGDDWKPPPTAYIGQPFRVRPRDHAGWGGWEWGLRHGWGDE